MSKISVETTGDFIIQDITNGQVVEAEGSTEVERTAFIDAQIDAGKLKESKAAPKHTDAEEKVEKADADAPEGAEKQNTTRKRG